MDCGDTNKDYKEKKATKNKHCVEQNISDHTSTI